MALSGNLSDKARILYLAINEREKSLKFYEILCDSWVDLGFDSSPDSSESSDSNLREIFSQIAQKEREILENAKMILDSLDLLESAPESIESTGDLGESNEAILLPSALPENILQELQNEIGAIDARHLRILALGVESHHLKACDFLIKTMREMRDSRDLGDSQDSQNAQDSQVLDALYQLQALSYNHHIPLLQGESPKENANGANLKNANQNSANPQQDLLLSFLQMLTNANPANLNPNQSAIPPINSLNDLLNQSPILREIKTSLDSFQNLYNQTKIIVAKLEKGELSQDELVAFLQRLRF